MDLQKLMVFHSSNYFISPEVNDFDHVSNFFTRRDDKEIIFVLYKNLSKSENLLSVKHSTSGLNVVRHLLRILQIDLIIGKLQTQVML